MKRQIGCAGSRLRHLTVRWQSALFLADKPEIFAQWIRWMETIPITGKRGHDARLVAVLHNPLAPIFDNLLKLHAKHIPACMPCGGTNVACELAAGTPQDEAVRFADTAAATTTQSLPQAGCRAHPPDIRRHPRRVSRRHE